MQKGGQDLSQGMDHRMSRVLRAGAKMEDGKQLRTGVDDQPEKDAPGWSSAAWFAIHPAADAGGADGRRSARARCARVRQHGTERLVMVACRWPKTREASEGSSPSASAERTMAT